VALYPDLAGKVALVTGGSRGIGRAIALVLAEAGAAVAVNCRERADAAAGVAREIEAKGGRAVVVQADVSVAAEVTELAAAVAKELGAVTSWSTTPGSRSPARSRS